MVTMKKIQLHLARITNPSLVVVVLAWVAGAAALAQGDRPNAPKPGAPDRDTQRIRLSEQSPLELYLPVYRERVQPMAGDRDVNPMGGQLPGSLPRTDREYARIVPPVSEQQRVIQTPSPEYGVTRDGKPCDIPPHIVPDTATAAERKDITEPRPEARRVIAPEGRTRLSTERERVTVRPESRPVPAPEKGKVKDKK